MVEACILLPIFLFLIMAMAGAFRFLQLSESVLYCGFQQMSKSSVQAAMQPETERVERLFLEQKIRWQVFEELEDEMLRLCSVEGVVDGDLVSQVFGDERDFFCTMKCGWTVGRGNGGGAFSGRLRFCARTYAGEDQNSVWIFPSWGKRYHRADCRTTGGQRKRTVVDVARQQGYTPCMICMTEEEK